jgi:hypothetical protein
LKTRDLIETGLTCWEVLEWLLEDIQAKLTRDYPDQPPEVIQQAIQTDPTGGSYAAWILNGIRNQSIIVPEDLPKTNNLLQRFHRLKASPTFQGDKNIFSYREYSDLAKAVGQKMSKGQRTEVRTVEGAKIVSQVGNLKLISLETPEASTAWSEGTEWCIHDPRAYALHKHLGRVMVVAKNDRPYVGLAVASRKSDVGIFAGQAMDVYDKPIDMATAKEIAPLFTQQDVGLTKKFEPRYAYHDADLALDRGMENKMAYLDFKVKELRDTGNIKQAKQTEHYVKRLRQDRDYRREFAQGISTHLHVPATGFIHLAIAVANRTGWKSKLEAE